MADDYPVRRGKATKRTLKHFTTDKEDRTAKAKKEWRKRWVARRKSRSSGRSSGR